MKNLSVTVLVAFVLFSVTGAYQYRDGTCKQLKQECTKDDECCSGNCRKHFSVFKRYCTDFKDHCLLLAGIKEMFMKPEFQAAACVYDHLLDGSNDTSRLNQEFGESHAMYAAYEPNTVVTVRRGDRTADLVVDDRPAGILDAAAANVTAAVGGRVLVLSRGTASQLDLPVAGPNRTAVACQARVQLLKNHPMLKTTLYATPAVGLLVGLYALVQYNVF